MNIIRKDDFPAYLKTPGRPYIQGGAIMAQATEFGYRTITSEVFSLENLLAKYPEVRIINEEGTYALIGNYGPTHDIISDDFDIDDEEIKDIAENCDMVSITLNDETMTLDVKAFELVSSYIEIRPEDQLIRRAILKD